MSRLVKILLLGDSIRMSYQPHVARILDGRAVVVGPSANCQYSQYTLDCLDAWVAELGKPDVIHWNNGLHDAGHNPEREPRQVPLGWYKRNLMSILGRLRELSDHIIWATTTPVHPDRAFLNTVWSWRNEEIDAYNREATRLMVDSGLAINDLHRLVGSDVERYLSDDQLHLSEAGQAACAQAVVQCCQAVLAGEK